MASPDCDYDHAGYIMAKQRRVSDSRHPDWLRRFEANRQAARWIHDHTFENEVVTGDNLPMTYLLADRKTDKCEVKDCPKLGIRYYLKNEDSAEFPTDKIPFNTGYPYVKVAEMLPESGKPAPSKQPN